MLHSGSKNKNLRAISARPFTGLKCFTEQLRFPDNDPYQLYQSYLKLRSEITFSQGRHGNQGNPDRKNGLNKITGSL